MLADLDVPYADTQAAALAWWLGDGPRPLAVLELTGPGGALRLELLGASHRAVATVDGVDVPEVVACGDAGTGLPAEHELRWGAVRYAFASSTTRCTPAQLRRAAGDLRRRYADHPQALLGAFPGSPHALTVLRGRPLARGWSWASWHVYPGTGELVRTRSTLVPA